MKGLIIKEKWIELIFMKQKVWEIRGVNTNIRGKIYLIQSGSKSITGECKIVHSFKLTKSVFENNVNKHAIYEKFEDIKYKNPYAWVIDPASIIKYKNPISYKHPNGAIVWVNIDNVSSEDNN